MTLRLALIGDPVAHSRSPALQRAFLAAAGIEGTYDLIRTATGEAARTIDALRTQGYHGLNVTTPLKEEAFARADWRDANALASGAVNTLVLGETIEGHNTDGIGALGALADAGLCDVAGARILVLGAGPTARSIIAALLAADAGVYFWNRTAARAEVLLRELAALPYEPGLRFEAVVAALAPAATLPAGALAAAVFDAPLLLDANYGERATLAKLLGRTALDGRTMLEHSARASFEIWRTAWGKPAPS